MTENLMDKAKAAAHTLKLKVAGFNEILADSDRHEITARFKEKGEEKVEEIILLLQKYKSVFTEAGYEIGGITASVSIPPDISISFKFLGSVDELKREEIKSQIIDDKMAVILLNSLFKASDYTEKIRVGDISLKTINIKLGLIPSISVSFA